MPRGPLYVSQGRKRPWRTFFVLERQKCPFEMGGLQRHPPRWGMVTSPGSFQKGSSQDTSELAPQDQATQWPGDSGGHVPAGLSLSPSNIVDTFSIPVNSGLAGHILPCVFTLLCKRPSALQLIGGYFFTVSLEKRCLSSAAPTGLPRVRRSQSGLSQRRSTNPWGVTKIFLEGP